MLVFKPCASPSAPVCPYVVMNGYTLNAAFQSFLARFLSSLGVQL